MINHKSGRLTVINDLGDTLECLCDCGKTTVVNKKYFAAGDVKSCGCLKKDTEYINLREKFEEKRVDGVAMHLFSDKARKDSSTGYRGVSKYYTRKSKELRYRAWITVDGKRYYKSGFLTAEQAYNVGRKYLEEKYLPKQK